MKENKEMFVAKCGDLLCEAIPNLIKCTYMLGRDLKPNNLGYINVYSYQIKDFTPIDYDRIDPEGEFVVVTTDNNYYYHICVTGNSFSSIAKEIFSIMSNK